MLTMCRSVLSVMDCCSFESIRCPHALGEFRSGAGWVFCGFKKTTTTQRGGTRGVSSCWNKPQFLHLQLSCKGSHLKQLPLPPGVPQRIKSRLDRWCAMHRCLDSFRETQLHPQAKFSEGVSARSVCGREIIACEFHPK